MNHDTISWLGVLLLASKTTDFWKCDFLNVYVGSSCHLRTMGKKVPKAAGFGYILSLRNYLNFLHMLQATLGRKLLNPAILRIDFSHCMSYNNMRRGNAVLIVPFCRSIA